MDHSKAKDQLPSSESDIKLESASQQPLAKQMSFSNRIIMNQLENPRELATLPNLTSLPKYQLETTSKIAGGSPGVASETRGDGSIGQLELEPKRHQQIHMIIKFGR